MATKMLSPPRVSAVRWLLLSLAMMLCALEVRASSVRDLPLRSYSHVADVDVQVVSRDRAEDRLSRRDARSVQHTDKLRLSFRAFDQLFHLHLEPNELLVPETGANVRYVTQSQDGEYITRTETIQRQDVRAYHGHVVHSDYTNLRLIEDQIGLRRDIDQETESDLGVMGPASVVLHDDEPGKPARFEGSFTWAGNQHTIQLPLNYHTSRSEHDPPISKRALDEDVPLVHRTTDRMSKGEAAALGIRDEVSSTAGCHADEYAFNQQVMKGMASPLSFFAKPSSGRLAKRSVHGTSLPRWLGGEESLFARDSALSTALDYRRAPSYSYEAALAKRQDDALGGSNNDSFVSHIGSTQGCPNTPRAVYVGVASDCSYTGRFNNASDTRVQILTLMNDVSNIYRTTFKVALGVVDIVVRDASVCNATASGTDRWNRDCDQDYTLDQRLSDFASWRNANPANGTGLWHLLTGCSQGSEVGVGYLGTLCSKASTDSDGTSVGDVAVSAVTSRQAQVMAHETGHNFGAVHDCVDGCTINGQTARQSNGAICCPRSSTVCNSDSNYIMSPVSETDTQAFSQCSIGNVCSLLGQGLDTSCVNDPSKNPRQTLSLQSCGNGILEPGEDCDAGPNGSSCCTTSCKLRSGARCDPTTSSCCTDTCSFASASTVCRPAVDERCDTAETCTGSSAECPTDIREKDGTSCASGGLSCASGHCTSRDLQCQSQSQADYTFSKACSPSADQSCSVSCQNPDNAQSCLILQQNFIDGTACGYGGRCQGGECKSGPWQDRFRGWYNNNLQIAIPVTVVIAFVVLALLYGLMRCLCLPLFARARGRPVRGAVGPVVAKPGRHSQPSYQQAPQNASYASRSTDPSPTPLMHDVGGRNSGRWVDAHAYNGYNGARQTHADI